jgi:hypothetical protein
LLADCPSQGWVIIPKPVNTMLESTHFIFKSTDPKSGPQTLPLIHQTSISPCPKSTQGEALNKLRTAILLNLLEL